MDVVALDVEGAVRVALLTYPLPFALPNVTSVCDTPGITSLQAVCSPSQ